MFKKTLSGLALALLMAACTGPVSAPVIDDFERDSLPSWQDPNGVLVGYVLWGFESGATVAISTATPSEQVPGFPQGNRVLKLDLTVGQNQWAGFNHSFTDEGASTHPWLSQDWSGYKGVSFWLYGNNTGGTLFFDIIENRHPGSTRDDAERFSVDIPDDFTGWKEFKLTWDQFHRKEIGNGAPDDGLSLKEVHGYAIGAFGSVPMGSHTYYVDQVALFR